MSRFFPIFRRGISLILLGTQLFPPIAWSQQPATYSRSTAIDQANSRAEREAEQMVSFSADRILPLLRQEPGLLLQVKKAVVRKAFEQGRILNPADLTDDALFDLIRKDDNIRVIATHEIVDRGYIKAKPGREELARNLPCRLPAATGIEAKEPDQSSLTNSKRPPSQEELYWAKHENDLDCYLTQYLPYGVTPSPSTQTQPSQLPLQQHIPDCSIRGNNNHFRRSSILNNLIHPVRSNLTKIPRPTIAVSCSRRRRSHQKATSEWTAIRVRWPASSRMSCPVCSTLARREGCQVDQ